MTQFEKKLFRRTKSELLDMLRIIAPWKALSFYGRWTKRDIVDVLVDYEHCIVL